MAFKWTAWCCSWQTASVLRQVWTILYHFCKTCRQQITFIYSFILFDLYQIAYNSWKILAISKMFWVQVWHLVPITGNLFWHKIKNNKTYFWFTFYIFLNIKCFWKNTTKTSKKGLYFCWTNFNKNLIVVSQVICKSWLEAKYI